VVTPDNRGTGRTRSANDDGIRTPARFADDVLALIDGLGLAKVDLAGASMGGMIVQEFALRYPERLRSLSILCSTFGGEKAISPSPEVLGAMLNGSKADATEEERRASLATQMHPETPAKRGDRLAFIEATRKAHPHSAEELLKRAQGIASFGSYDRLESLDVPTLVMAGTDDVLIPTENSRLLAGRIRGSKLVLIEDAGHIFFVEQPDAASAALLGFIESIGGPGSE
jgi:pimeloyl-ACP methyl ester carboxylesterase